MLTDVPIKGKEQLFVPHAIIILYMYYILHRAIKRDFGGVITYTSCKKKTDEC